MVIGKVQFHGIGYKSRISSVLSITCDFQAMSLFLITQAYSNNEPTHAFSPFILSAPLSSLSLPHFLHSLYHLDLSAMSRLSPFHITQAYCMDDEWTHAIPPSLLPSFPSLFCPSFTSFCNIQTESVSYHLGILDEPTHAFPLSFPSLFFILSIFLPDIIRGWDKNLSLPFHP